MSLKMSSAEGKPFGSVFWSVKLQKKPSKVISHDWPLGRLITWLMYSLHISPRNNSSHVVIFANQILIYIIGIRLLNSLRTRQNRRHFAVDIFMKMYWSGLRYLRSLFPNVQSSIFQHWFRQWFGADQATSPYLNQCLIFYIYASLGVNELTALHVEFM